jgi:hypothetical protein
LHSAAGGGFRGRKVLEVQSGQPEETAVVTESPGQHAFDRQRPQGLERGRLPDPDVRAADRSSGLRWLLFSSFRERKRRYERKRRSARARKRRIIRVKKHSRREFSRRLLIFFALPLCFASLLQPERFVQKARDAVMIVYRRQNDVRRRLNDRNCVGRRAADIRERHHFKVVVEITDGEIFRT